MDTRVSGVWLVRHNNKNSRHWRLFA